MTWSAGCRTFLAAVGITAHVAACALEPSQVFAQASPSVVVVFAVNQNGQRVQGSGVALTSTAVATNCHVVAEASSILVRHGQSTVSAQNAAQDMAHDLCLLNVPTGGLVAVKVAGPSAARPGMRAYSIGSPEGLELSISEGLVSGVRRLNGRDYIQTSAPISHGSSGGGLFDQEGALLGLTTFAINNAQNLNFAVPADVATSLLSSVSAEPSTQSHLVLRDSVRTALKAGELPPELQFTSLDQRLAYLRWLGAMSARLKGRMAEEHQRIEFLQAVWYEGRRAGVEPALVLGVVEVQSNFKKYAMNDFAARGYMLVNARWSKEIGDGETEKLFQLQPNLRFGCVILRHYIDRANGDLFNALVAYHQQTVGQPDAASGKNPAAFPNSVLAARKHWLFADVPPAKSSATP